MAGSTNAAVDSGIRRYRDCVKTRLYAEGVE